MAPNKLHKYCLVEVPEESGFTIYNLPFGVFKAKSKRPSVGVALGEIILDMAAIYERGIFEACLKENVFAKEHLNDFMSLGRKVRKAVRENLQAYLTGKISGWQYSQAGVEWWPLHSVEMMMPFKVAGYTDFYSGMHHAENVGKMFRPSAPPLLPNWKSMPVAYHGRSSSVILSGTPVKRPWGQYLDENGQIRFGPTRKLDYEMELGYVVGQPSVLGNSIHTEDAHEHLFGCVLLNDLSARDIQRWEYQPLGPFLGKNFATPISPWVVTMDALEPFMTKINVQEPPMMPYLKDSEMHVPEIALGMELQTASGQREVIGKVNSSEVYWSIAQQIAHHTINGCNLETGDILATGTISGEAPLSWGSLLERTFDGKQPVSVGNEQRTYLEDGDTLIYSGTAGTGPHKVGFGSVITPIHQAKKWP
jgi:fumarylacetoacetase